MLSQKVMKTIEQWQRVNFKDDIGFDVAVCHNCGHVEHGVSHSGKDYFCQSCENHTLQGSDASYDAWRFQLQYLHHTH
jgi:hypothetical protein